MTSSYPLFVFPAPSYHQTVSWDGSRIHKPPFPAASQAQCQTWQFTLHTVWEFEPFPSANLQLPGSLCSEAWRSRPLFLPHWWMQWSALLNEMACLDWKPPRMMSATAFSPLVTVWPLCPSQGCRAAAEDLWQCSSPEALRAWRWLSFAPEVQSVQAVEEAVNLFKKILSRLHWNVLFSQFSP